METLLRNVGRSVRLMNVVAGIALTFMMSLTVLDVILRFFRMPIVGTYELVAFSGALVIGFSLPFTSWIRGHIYVDFIISRFSRRLRNTFNAGTRCIVISLFFLIGWNLIRYGVDLRRSGEVSLTLQMPFYPFAYGIAICCFVECLVLGCDLLKIFGGRYE